MTARPLLLAAAVLVAGLLRAQTDGAGAPRLVESIEAPLAYLALGAEADDRGARREPAAGRRAVQRLLADPAFDELFGAVDAQSASIGRSLALVRGVLARSSGEIEIALTGVVPRVGQPLLVLRAELRGEEVDRLQTALGGKPGERADGLTAPHRIIDGRQTYVMLGADGEVDLRAGHQVELALVGSDLVMANDATAVEELIDPDRRTSARRAVLANEPSFTRLQQRVAASAGSLLVYGDWARLGQRLRSTNRNVLATMLLQWSDIDSADGVMAVLSADADSDEFSATVLLDFEAEADGRIAGWFGSAMSLPARRLARDLPAGGLGGLVLALDLESAAADSARLRNLLVKVRASFKKFGLDFDRSVLSRLGDRGTCQLLFDLGADGVAAEIQSIYSMRARDLEAAQDLFTDLRRAAEHAGVGDVSTAQERGTKNNTDILLLRRQPSEPPTCVAISGRSVLVAFDADTIDAFVAEERRSRRGARKLGELVQKAGGNVTGLFDIDLTPWFEQFAAMLAAKEAKVDLDRIPRRHRGSLELQPREGGAILRISVWSSR